jgi:Cytochrome P450
MKGMLVHPYNEQFVKMRRTSMTLLKDLGYGRNYVETRIGVELDVLVDRIRKCDGRSFDPTDMLYQCNNGIIMSFMFGCQFDYDNDPLMQHVNVYVRAGTQAGPEIEFFPILRFVPKYKRQLNTVFTAQK